MAGKLGVVGITVNAMALIAPGAFLWITFQVQAAAASGATNFGRDMWFGIIVALLVAFSTAFPYAELARKFPEAGCGGAYYFADQTLKDSGIHRKAKLLIGWSSHLFYWVYPGVMTAFMVTLCESFLGMPQWGRPLLAALTAGAVAAVAWRGVTGSTAVAVAINAIQLSTLVFLSAVCLQFRFNNPLDLADEAWTFESVVEVLTPKSVVGVLFQSSIAILILVGFDSATSLSGDSENPSRDIPRGVIASLGIQGCAYLLEYGAANAALNSQFGGLEAAVASDAPIGDLAVHVGDAVLGAGAGKPFMGILAVSVALAVFGSTLAALSTAVRFSQAMADDGELPASFSKLNDFGMPSTGLKAAGSFTAFIGAVGSMGGVTTLTAVTLASNIGTFVLYFGVCVTCYYSFENAPSRSTVSHVVVPLVGAALNVSMVVTIFYIGFAGGDVAVYLALGLACVWAAVAVAYWSKGTRARVVQVGVKVERGPKAAGDASPRLLGAVPHVKAQAAW